MNRQRARIVREIDALQDANCKGCPIKRDFGKAEAKLSKHCGSECAIGIRLRTLGKELASEARPRKKPNELDGGYKMANPKFTLTAEQIHTERSTGKTIKQIAVEHSVGESTVYKRMGPPGAKAEDPAIAELEKAKRELEEAKLQIEVLKSQNASVVALSGEAAEKQQAEIERLQAEHEQHAMLRRNAYEAHNAAQARLQERVKQLEEQLDTAESEKALLLQTIERAAQPEPPTEAQLLDRAIGELTRVRKLIHLYAAGE